MKCLVCDVCERVIRKEHQESVDLRMTLRSPDGSNVDMTMNFTLGRIEVTPANSRKKRDGHLCGFCVRDAFRTAELA